MFGKWLRCMGQGLNILETALLCWKWLKNLTNKLKYVGIDIYMWDTALVFE